MNDVPDYTGNKIIIYTEDGSTELAKAVVRTFDKPTVTITVDRKAFRSEPEDVHVSMLIFHREGLFEYKGTIHKNAPAIDHLEIGLYKGKNKENRGTVRYTVNASALVEKYLIGKTLVPLRVPQQVMVLNVSANGCLIRANTKFLNVGTTFLFQMELSGGVVSFYATAVRTKSINLEESEYGCTLIAPSGATQ